MTFGDEQLVTHILRPEVTTAMIYGFCARVGTMF